MSKEIVAFETPDMLVMVSDLLTIRYTDHEYIVFMDDLLLLAKKAIFDIDNGVTDIDVAEVVNKYMRFLKDKNSAGYILGLLKPIINDLAVLLLYTDVLDRTLYVVNVNEYKIVIEAILLKYY